VGGATGAGLIGAGGEVEWRGKREWGGERMRTGSQSVAVITVREGKRERW